MYAIGRAGAAPGPTLKRAPSASAVAGGGSAADNVRTMSAVAPACPRCRAAVPGDARFCPQCGAPLAAVAAAGGERRQVTVLFADLAGYTALSQALDPEETHRILTRYFELLDAIVAECGGTVDKHVGDAVMAVFGAPIAHGDDTLRALRAATQVHGAMERLSAEFARPLRAHAGVASGEVVAAPTGSDVHRQYTMTGDAVNLAARLADLARGGETVIADDVHRAYGEAIEAEPVGSVAIRGLAGEVPVWRLRGLRATPLAEPPLIGRTAELARFEAMLADVAAGRGGAKLIVRAEPGLGKTRLVRAFASRAGVRGFAAHAAAVLDFGGAQGRDAVRTLLASVLGVPDDVDGDLRREALVRAVAAGRAAADEAPFVADLLGMAGHDAAYEAMDDAVRSSGRVRALCDVVARATAQGPLLLIVEDMHWATPWVARCLEALGERAQGLPLVVVATTRPEGDAPGTPGFGQAWPAWALAPLDAAEAGALAHSFLATNPDIAQRCIDRAQGNPLFLTQLLRSGADGALIPATLQSLVQSRLDRLVAADKHALQAAAVIGQRFDPTVLRHLLDDAAYDPTALLGRDLVSGDREGGYYTFTHALIRDGAYASLLHSARRSLHQRAADWFASRDAVLAAEHLDRADDGRAAPAYLAAARAEAAALRFDSALRLVRRGAQLPGDGAMAHALARFEGDLARDTGDVPASRAAFERAAEHATTDAERCAALAGIAAAHRATGSMAEGLAVLDVLEPLALAAGLTREASRAAYLRGCLEFGRGDTAASRRAQEAARARALEANDPEGEAHALSGLADVLYADGRMASAYAAFERCVALCDREGLARFALNNRAMLAVVHSYLAPLDGALHVLDRVRADARELRHRAAEVMADESEAWVRVSQGMYAEAVAPAQRSLALAREIGSRRFVVFDQGLLAYAYAHLGRHDDAATALAEAFDLTRDLGMRFAGGILLGARALLTRDASELAAVIAEADRALAAGTPAHNHFWLRRVAITMSLAHGDAAGALRQAALLEAFTRAEPLPTADVVVAWGRALAAAADGQADRTVLAALRERAQALHWPGLVPALDAALA